MSDGDPLPLAEPQHPTNPHSSDSTAEIANAQSHSLRFKITMCAYYGGIGAHEHADMMPAAYSA